MPTGRLGFQQSRKADDHPMHCVVTAGPTYEPLDQVRRLTNFSTGRLGSELAAFLTHHGHKVTLLLGEQAIWAGERKAEQLQRFSTTGNLRAQLYELRTCSVDAVFHAAAVSDFSVGKLWVQEADGRIKEVSSGKVSTREGRLLAELVVTPKIIAELRDWFPSAYLVGWKYEVDGDQATALSAARRQLADCHTDACVLNGPAYGTGFGLVDSAGRCVELTHPAALFGALEELLRR